MSDKSKLWIILIIISIMWVIIGGSIGYMKGSATANEKAREIAKEKFVDAISWAINENLLIVNSNKVEELEKSGTLKF